MKRYIRNLWSALVNNENIELYIIHLVALPLIILSITGTDDNYIRAAILAVLTLLAGAVINDRHDRKEFYRTMNEIGEKGIESAFNSLPRDLLDSKYVNAHNEILIMSTWIPDVNPISENLRDAIQRGVKVKFLLLDPASPTSTQRIKDQGLSRSEHVFTAHDFLSSALVRHGLEGNPNVEIKYYDALPAFYLRCIDEWVLLGFYWHGNGSSEGPMISISKRSSRFGRFAMDTFDRLWNEAKYHHPKPKETL